MTPWLPNLTRFCKQCADDVKRQKVSVILDKLIAMTIDETEVVYNALNNKNYMMLNVFFKFKMYPSIQAKIWGNMGRVSELLDLILDGFIKVVIWEFNTCLFSLQQRTLKKSISGGLGSLHAEVLADTTVALAAANVGLVAANVVNRLMNVFLT